MKVFDGEIIKRHGPCDVFVGSGYWLNDDGSERIVICSMSGRIGYYNNELGIEKLLFDPYDI